MNKLKHIKLFETFNEIDPYGEEDWNDKDKDILYRNYYKCPKCKLVWADNWECACNDRCPNCNKEIEPYSTVIL